MKTNFIAIVSALALVDAAPHYMPSGHDHSSPVGDRTTRPPVKKVAAGHIAQQKLHKREAAPPTFIEGGEYHVNDIDIPFTEHDHTEYPQKSISKQVPRTMMRKNGHTAPPFIHKRGTMEFDPDNVPFSYDDLPEFHEGEFRPPVKMARNDQFDAATHPIQRRGVPDFDDKLDFDKPMPAMMERSDRFDRHGALPIHKREAEPTHFGSHGHGKYKNNDSDIPKRAAAKVSSNNGRRQGVPPRH